MVEHHNLQIPETFQSPLPTHQIIHFQPPPPNETHKPFTTPKTPKNTLPPNTPPAAQEESTYSNISMWWCHCLQGQRCFSIINSPIHHCRYTSSRPGGGVGWCGDFMVWCGVVWWLCSVVWWLCSVVWWLCSVVWWWWWWWFGGGVGWCGDFMV